MTDYNMIITTLPSLLEDTEYSVSILSNTSALLNEYMDNLNWVGFYILKDDYLYLSAFQGKPACIKIKVGNGVCGTCIKENKAILVTNVHEFKGHIACDSASNSEICIPIYKNNILYGLLDIDSPLLNRFDNNDKKNLEIICNIISDALSKTSF